MLAVLAKESTAFLTNILAWEAGQLGREEGLVYLRHPKRKQ
jgi:hypothetical protein